MKRLCLILFFALVPSILFPQKSPYGHRDRWKEVSDTTNVPKTKQHQYIFNGKHYVGMGTWLMKLVDAEDEFSSVKQIEGWVTFSSHNPTLGILPANSKVTTVWLYVTEGFNGDGTNAISCGYDGNVGGYFPSITVNTPGNKSVTIGPSCRIIDAESRSVEAYYSYGSTPPTQGKAHIVLYYTICTQSP